eukprot:1139161-Pelagomonas_calceolata.AAC.2
MTPPNPESTPGDILGSTKGSTKLGFTPRLIRQGLPNWQVSNLSATERRLSLKAARWEEPTQGACKNT